MIASVQPSMDAGIGEHREWAFECRRACSQDGREQDQTLWSESQSGPRTQDAHILSEVISGSSARRTTAQSAVHALHMRLAYFVHRGLSNAQDMWLSGHHFDGHQRYV
jgi:hypothetical protein